MKIVVLIFRYLPLILEAMIAVERVVGAGKGKEKKDLVLGAFQAATEVGEKSDDKTVAAFSHMIDHIVSTFNQIGVFHKAESPEMPSADVGDGQSEGQLGC